MPTKYTEDRPECVADTECYPNYWSIAFRCINTGRVRVFRRTESEDLDVAGVAKVFRNWRVYTFNGNNYDMPMIALAMNGATNGQLKRASDEIILTDLRPWQFYERHGLELPAFLDHIDLAEVSPGSPQKPSLKLYAGRMHSRRMQELPYDPDQWLTEEEQGLLEEYEVNDLLVTSDLVKELSPQIALRAQMSEQYGVDLRSKSDAQVAEAVIRSEIQRMTGRKVYKPDDSFKSRCFHYVPPKFVRFITPMMQEMLERVRRANFVVNNKGVVEMPSELDVAIPIGSSVYRMGIGGLHSTESRISHFSDDDYVLLDRDVTSFYPSIIINERLYPEHIGEDFLLVYRDILKRRIAAKKSGNKTVAESLKITLNGSFGKFGSPYSALFSPDLMIQTTVTGQLSILMLIEEVEEHGMRVVSANTDGFVTLVPRKKRDLFNAIIFDWELATGFGTEETEYLALHSRDVNNYIAITSAGKVKTKGAFAPSGPGQAGAAGLKKNPDCQITIDAAVAHLRDGADIEQTIRSCRDITKFLTVRRVTGGAVLGDKYLGKAIRWYYAAGVDGSITYKKNGNNVPMSQGAKPCMELPDEFPDDIDYSCYVREAYAILEDVGVGSVDPALAGRRGQFLARLPEEKTLHTVDAKTGRASCGKARSTIRDRWIEYERLPEGHRHCAKCRRANDL